MRMPQTDVDMFDAAGCELSQSDESVERATAGGDSSSGLRGDT